MIDTVALLRGDELHGFGAMYPSGSLYGVNLRRLVFGSFEPHGVGESKTQKFRTIPEMKANSSMMLHIALASLLARKG